MYETEKNSTTSAERNSTTSAEKNTGFANIPRTKVYIPETFRKSLFQNGCVFILHNLVEDIYATHLFDTFINGDYIDKENHYLYTEYYNDDMSRESEVQDYGSPFPYTTYFEVAYVYKFNKETQKMDCLFNRNDKFWERKEIKVPEVQPGMFVVVDYEYEDDFLNSVVVYNEANDELRLVYSIGTFDRWTTIKRQNEDDASGCSILFIGKNFDSFETVEEYMNRFYRDTEDTFPYLGEAVFIHPDFKKHYEKNKKPIKRRIFKNEAK